MPDFPKGGSAAEVWAYGTRVITGGAAVPGDSMNLTAGEENAIQAKILSDATPFSGVRVQSMIAATTPTEASVLMDGTEKTLIEVTDVKLSEIQAWLDLTPLQAGDTIVVKYYRKVKAAGTYALYASETYSGVQSVPLLKIIQATIYRDTKITAQQTAGVNRTLDIQVVRQMTA